MLFITETYQTKAMPREQQPLSPQSEFQIPGFVRKSGIKNIQIILLILLILSLF